MHQLLGIPYLELDSLQHQPNWTSIKPDQFREAVSDFVGEHQDWVIDGNYQIVSDLIHPQCTDLIWLDVSLLKVLWQLGSRSISRVFLRTELWNGNREQVRSHLSLNPEESVLLWAMKTHRNFPLLFEELKNDPALSHVQCHRMCNQQTYKEWILRTFKCD